MNTPSLLRKPKLHFETEVSPSHIAFDDGKDDRWVLPWFNFIRSRWSYREPDVIQVEMSEWLIVLKGVNLEPLHRAIRRREVTDIRARPEFASERERDGDSFVLEIKFKDRPATKARAVPGQIEFDLPNNSSAQWS